MLVKSSKKKYSGTNNCNKLSKDSNRKAKSKEEKIFINNTYTLREKYKEGDK